MSNETETSVQDIGKQKSKRTLFTVIAIILIVIVLLAVLLLSNQNDPWLGRFMDTGGVTMVDLQMDYDMWKGDFKSYNENDTVVFRDTITNIQFDYNPYGYPITALYFKARPLPSLEDLESDRVQNESWYTWKPGGWGEVKTMFPMKYDFDSNEYLPEARINVQGDAREKFSVGDTVEVTLHVWKGLYRMRMIESIFEFTYSVTPEKVQVAG